MTDNEVTVSLGGSFMLNAGICGFIRFLKHNDAVEGIDYEINGQILTINADYIRNNDIPALYIKTMAEIFEPSTKFYRVLNERFEIEKLCSLPEIDDKQKKRLNDLYKNFSELMLKASYLSVYKLLPEYEGITPVTEEMLTDFKKESDLAVKHEKYKNITELLSQQKLKNLLIYTELIYTSFKLFFNENPQSKKIPCLCKPSEKYETTFENWFILPFIKEIEIAEKKKIYCCIECMNATKHKRAFSFLVDTTDDLDRKKSYYWNCKPDAYVCPVCGLMYAFIPLGFAIMGTDAVFINSNSSIEVLCKIMNSMRQKADDDNALSVNKRIMRTFTSEKIEALNKTTGNIQVIIRSPEISHFKFDVIDKFLISGLNKGKKYLSMLEKRWLSADGRKFDSVYDMVFDRILGHLSLYPLIDKILKSEIDKSSNINYLKGILRLEIIFYGGKEMDDLNKKIDAAFQSGKALRRSILGNDADFAAAEDDNRLRGFVYRLVNLASVGDCPQFIDTVIRIYAGFNLTIPAVFKDCYKSEQMFKAIAHGFILGLKYVKYNENNETKGE